MSSRPIPVLTEHQWDFMERRLDMPAPKHMQERLKRVIEDAGKIRRK
ncbi:MAG: hypothetical protein ACLPY5_08250 [Candidatus Bathyarchaeia archaeon]